jgi:hypothetical protein
MTIRGRRFCLTAHSRRSESRLQMQRLPNVLPLSAGLQAGPQRPETLPRELFCHQNQTRAESAPLHTVVDHPAEGHETLHYISAMFLKLASYSLTTLTDARRCSPTLADARRPRGRFNIVPRTQTVPDAGRLQSREDAPRADRALDGAHQARRMEDRTQLAQEGALECLQLSRTIHDRS